MAVFVASMLSAKVTGAAVIFHPSPEELSSASAIETTLTFDQYGDFEELGRGRVVLDGIAFRSSNPDSAWTTHDVGSLGPPSLPNVFSTGNDGLDVNTLTFGGRSTDAIGFFLFTQVRFPTLKWLITVEEVGGARKTFPFEQSGANQYYGFTSTLGITSVIVDDDPSDNFIPNAFFDDVARGAIVPEPDSVAIALMSLASLCLCRRRGHAG
ncbi:MAG: hypothetical protein SGJ19_11175 [Planctomycetia bacterium]|nr:hypothetical protein [Planctomycetia bacterium]